MPDVKITQQSILLEWVYKLYQAKENDKWSYIPFANFLKYGKDLICFKANVTWKKFKTDGITLTPFWSEVLKAWISSNTETNVLNPLSNAIWNNKNVTYHNEVLFFRRWSQRGIIYIRDLLGEDMCMLSFPQINDKIGTWPALLLEYNVVKVAIQNFMTQHPQQHDMSMHYADLLFDNKALKSAREFRIHLVKKIFSEPCSVNFWNNKLGISITKWHWEIIRAVSKESRLRELHWKILHNIYPTNIILNKIGIVVSNVCSYCENKIDYIEHFFVECPKISYLWTFIEVKIYSELKSKIKLSVGDILLGFPQKEQILTSDMRYINYLIIIGKLCISKYKYGTPINIISLFENELRLRNRAY